jgi:hypothetical protein
LPTTTAQILALPRLHHWFFEFSFEQPMKWASNTKFVTSRGMFERGGLTEVGRIVLPAKPAEITGTMLKHRASVR